MARDCFQRQNNLEWPEWAKDESFPGYFQILNKYVVDFFQKQVEDEEIKKLLFRECDMPSNGENKNMHSDIFF